MVLYTHLIYITYVYVYMKYLVEQHPPFGFVPLGNFGVFVRGIMVGEVAPAPSATGLRGAGAGWRVGAAAGGLGGTPRVSEFQVV
jgi:hypothetical protein